MVLDNILSKKIEDFKQFIANMIPIAGNQTPSADTTNGSSGTNMDYAKSDHTHPKSTLYAEADHTHSQYLTTHQDISGKLNISQTDYKGKNVVVDNTTGNITFEDKPTVPQASTSSPLTDMTGGAIGSDSKYAKADHQHPLSSAYATANHNHGQIDKDGKLSTTTSTVNNVVVTDESNIVKIINKLPSANVTHQDISGKLDIAQTSYKGKNVVVDSTTGNITFENKPSIPSDVSDLTDNNNTAFTPKSHSHTSQDISDVDLIEITIEYENGDTETLNILGITPPL